MLSIEAEFQQEHAAIEAESIDWSMKPSIAKEVVLDALMMAMWRLSFVNTFQLTELTEFVQQGLPTPSAQTSRKEPN